MIGIGSWACKLRNKTPKRGQGKAGARGGSRLRMNETWAMDFVHDQLATGRKLRVLTIVDTFSRFSRGASNLGSASAAAMWSKCSSGWVESSGSPLRSVSTRAPSLSHGIWICGLSARLTLDFSRPGKADRQMRSSSPLTQVPGRVPERPLGS